MATTDNFQLNIPSYNEYADIKVLNENFKTIDKGLTLDVGNSTGTGNNYTLDTGNITLTSNNKGVSFKFFADKDSDTTNSVKIVINGTSYSLLDNNKKIIRKIKKDVPVTITYAGDGVNFFLASAGNTLDEVSFTSDELLTGNSANDSEGNKIDGTMANNGIYIKNNFAINEKITLPKGYYDGINISQNIPTKESQTYTPTTSNQIISANQYLKGNQTILGDANLVAGNIISGKSIFGVSGSATIQSLGGKRIYNGTLSVTQSKGNLNQYTFNIGFQPTTVIVTLNSSPSTSFIDCRSTDINWINHRYKDYQSSSSSSSTWITQILSFTNNGFVYQDSQSSSTLTKDTTVSLNILAFG